MAALVELLLEQGIRLRSYGEGDRKTLCPKCSHTRKDRRDPCLSVRIDSYSALWNCHHCQ
jgi:twinkle protein